MANTLTIREFLVAFGIEADTEDLEAYDKAVEATAEDLEDLKGVVLGVTGAIVAAGAALIANTLEVAQWATEYRNAAEFLETTEERLQGIVAAGQRVGAAVELDDAVDAMATLADKAKDAIDGNETMIEDFGLLGIAVDDLRGKKPDELFDLLADAMAGAEDQGVAVAASERLIADAGRRLAPVLMQGSEALREFTEEAVRNGEILSGDQLDALNAVGDAWRITTGLVGGIRRELGAEFAPVLERVLTGFNEWIRVNRAWISENIDQAMTRIGDAVEYVGGVVEDVNEIVEDRFGGWSNVLRVAGEALAAYAGLRAWRMIRNLITTITAAARVMGITSAASFASVAWPVIALTAAVAALFLILDDLATWMRGGESVIGSFFDTYGEGETILDSIARLGESLFDLFVALQPVVGELGSALLEALEAVWEVMQPFVEVLIADAIKDVERLVAVLQIALEGITAMVRVVTRLLKAPGEVLEDAKRGAAFLKDLALDAVIPGAEPRVDDATRARVGRNLLTNLGPAATAVQVAGGGGTTNNSNTRNVTNNNTITFPGADAAAVRDALENGLIEEATIADESLGEERL